MQAPTGARYMDDVWVSGHLASRKVARFAVPMDRDEPRTRWSGGSGLTLSKVDGLDRSQMNYAALWRWEGHWDVLQCAPKTEQQRRAGERRCVMELGYSPPDRLPESFV